ncbi:hypothetical protein [Leptolyngbya sp. FACHB-17]|uniref:hypothetical protein n=1 Tax=unclassified Leptolyngbya TaxID=2650499 RepID=UPI00168087AE|nr:hypothetical protein [Leptolyngbya sp. FACHB-17]MBD2082647.1 hypothetical protein [Leptolyngbya sp. FACHB-17]
MATYKLKGKVDANGQLVITETIDLPPGDVEVIVFQRVSNASPEATQPSSARPTKIKFLREWFAKTEPAPPNFDADEARWQALKEKYDL